MTHTWRGDSNLRKADLVESERTLKLSTPWEIKEPRFARTERLWLPLPESYAPTLLCPSRDADEITMSFDRRGERTDAVDGKTELCEEVFDSWPWWRMKVDFDELSKWSGLSIPGQGGEGHGVSGARPRFRTTE